MDQSFGLVGNGGLLARVADDGTLTEMYFPSVGFHRHIIQSQFGFAEGAGEHRWLGDRRQTRRQRYLKDTNVLVTSVWAEGLGIQLTDFAHPQLPVLVRQAEIENTRTVPVAVRLSHAEAASLDEAHDRYGHNVAYYDTRNRCLVRFRGHPFDNAMEGHSLLLLAGAPVQDAFQCGISYEREGSRMDAYLDLADGRLGGNDYAAGSERGTTTAQLWRLSLAPGETRTVALFLVGGATLDAAERTLEAARSVPTARLLAEAVTFWRGWIAPGAAWSERIPDPSLRRLYRRSLLVNKLLQDRTYGAIIAGPSVAPDYRYCWVRDGTFAAWAFDLAGYHDEAARFYQWCARTQMAEGLWYQNHYTDGRRHWPGIQVDQVGTAIWGIRQHVARTGDLRFLAEMWPVAHRAAEYILSRLDVSTGLVYSEQDLWEETAGCLAYTNAACQAGLRDAASLADEVGVLSDGRRFQQAADHLLAAMRQQLIREGAYVGAREPLQPSRGRHDYRVDLSLAGLAAPFAVVDPRAPEMARAVERIEQVAGYPEGGVGRYAGDLFMGGNPWPLGALWLCLYYVGAGQWPPPHNHLEWCLRHATPRGFLAEQQDRRTGAPLSAVPLAWAHAWLIAVAHALDDRGLLRNQNRAL
ncbi:MAG: hypothetical protein HY321_15625 [Armatimonadetes bacterium]|nr:hypothetical protein [Armatimonadota bacterium]